MTQTAPTLRPAKGLSASKTLMFNLLVIALGALDQGLGLLQPMLGAHTYEVLAAVLVVGNSLLRLFSTDSPVALLADPLGQLLDDAAPTPKGAWQSKTLWFNGLIGLAAALLLGGSGAPVEAVQAITSGHAPEVLAGVLAAGNALLRLVTTQPLQLRGAT